MSADLHIHVFDGLTESDLRSFFSNTLGSKYFAPVSIGQGSCLDHYKKISDVPNIWIGGVSWLKAGLSEDSETFIPNAVAEINELIGENLPVLDNDLTEKILSAMDLPNDTGYSLAKKDAVQKFLGEHKGQQLFTVSW